MLFGNAVIGVGEGLLIAVLFGARKRVALPIMIAANVVSMFIGKGLIGVDELWVEVQSLFAGPPIYTLGKVLWTAVAVSFVLSWLIEWPFCRVALWRQRRAWLKSLLASGIAQTAVYAVLIPLFFSWGISGILGDVGIDESFVPSVTDEATVYFIAPDDGHAYRVRLNGTGREKVLDLGERDPYARLTLRPSEDGTHADLWFIKWDGRRYRERLLVERVGGFRVSPVVADMRPSSGGPGPPGPMLDGFWTFAWRKSRSGTCSPGVVASSARRIG